MKKYLLPIGIILAVIAAFIIPEAGIFIKNTVINRILLLAIFFINGRHADFSQIRTGRKATSAFISGALAAFVIYPLLALLTARLFGLGELATLGLVTVAATSPALSSSVVLTKISGGNTMFSLSSTIICNILGTFIMPVMIACLLFGMAIMTVSPLNMMLELGRQMVLPFILGALTKFFVKKDHPAIIGTIPPLCLILLLFASFSSSVHLLRTAPLLPLILSGIAGFLLHCCVTAIIWYGSGILKYSLQNRKALLFTAGSKGISVTLAALTIMNANEGKATVPCIVFYILQLLLDSFIAARMAKSCEKESVPDLVA